MMGSACTRRYRSILSLLQLPIRLMISVPTPEQSSAMAPDARRKRAETSLCVKPRWVPVRSLTVALRWAVTIVGVTFVQRPLGVLKWSRGVSAGRHVFIYGPPDVAMPPFCTRGGFLRSHFLFSHPHAIFLCSEDKYQKCGGSKFIISGGDGGEHCDSHTECYI